MATAGPNFPGTAADDATTGTVAWNNPGNITTNDGVYSETNFVSTSNKSHYLKATNFGFSIPSGATINGITVTVNLMSLVSPAPVKDNIVKIMKGGSYVGTDLKSATTWPSSFTSRTYGGSSNLWGTTWTDTDINASNFGFGISVLSASFKAQGKGRVDYITITIDYTASGGGSFIATRSLNIGQAGNRASTF